VLLQALADEEDAVIAEAVAFLTAVIQRRQLRHRALLAAAGKVRTRLGGVHALMSVQSFHIIVFGP
jgi:hypothetical protein